MDTYRVTFYVCDECVWWVCFQTEDKLVLNFLE